MVKVKGQGRKRRTLNKSLFRVLFVDRINLCECSDWMVRLFINIPCPRSSKAGGSLGVRRGPSIRSHYECCSMKMADGKLLIAIGPGLYLGSKCRQRLFHWLKSLGEIG